MSVIQTNPNRIASLGGKSSTKSLSTHLRGLVVGGEKPALERNDNTQGLVFFTRPQLNLSTSNIRKVDELNPLLSNDPYSLARWVRCTLDPRLMIPKNSGETLECPLVNNEQAFIPMASNTLLNMNGFPDRAVEMYTSDPGPMKEVYMQVDGRSMPAGPISINLDFANSKGEPMALLLETWAKYPEYLFQGYINRYFDFVVRDDIDYNVRIYRIILDVHGKTVTNIAATLPGIWQVAGLGSRYDYDRLSRQSAVSEELSYPVSVPSVEMDAPILIDDFNRTVYAFKPEMETASTRTFGDMAKVNFAYHEYFMNDSFYRINPSTLEFEYWVDGKVGSSISNQLISEGIIDASANLFTVGE